MLNLLALIITIACYTIGLVSTFYCPNCCGGSTTLLCCSNLANILHATVTQTTTVSGCTCLNGVSIQLNHSSFDPCGSGVGSWQGTIKPSPGCPNHGSGGNDQFHMTLSPCCGGLITGFNITFDCGGGGSSSIGSADPSSTCNPPNLIFLNVDSNNECCVGGNKYTITVTA